jgi:D-arginine dehydrogenase
MDVDVIVIGAGIAGVSVAAELAGDGRRVVVLEQESRPGYHSTGRSAALFSEVYGSSVIRTLSRASREFLTAPPSKFCDVPLTKPRGLLYVARNDQLASLERLSASLDVGHTARWLSRETVLTMSPLLRADYVAGGVYEPAATDIDVGALHQAYIATLKRSGCRVILDAPVTSLRASVGTWLADCRSSRFAAPVVVNAAGAWASVVGRMAGATAISIEPRRRTVLVVEPPAGVDIAMWPLVIDVDEQFYFKPDAGLLLLSPADETPSEPQDVQADEWDVAVAVDRIEQATTLVVHNVKRRWAGLRSFAADRNPVVGFDSAAPGFFWLAGQGGFGIQTAPALARLAAGLITGKTAQADLLGSRSLLEHLSPNRFAEIQKAGTDGN